MVAQTLIPGRGLCLVGVGDSSNYVSLTRLVGESNKHVGEQCVFRNLVVVGVQKILGGGYCSGLRVICDSQAPTLLVCYPKSLPRKAALTTCSI